ncbi:Negative elongation factor D [Hondaea fermentalgiana]|uniref:Negative elongation factor D n=1 Tax=Hondaea fermentalgiana TaxID=2315210 RepID=A0A2R5GRY1_9STRA|nr:Negative elongation factor D [Hondaea fermentalgiana]|eukprot:GBG33355.1 Negative elongation factor D [Hondaea fermentalgiana]
MAARAPRHCDAKSEAKDGKEQEHEAPKPSPEDAGNKETKSGGDGNDAKPQEPLAPGWTELDAGGMPFYFHKASGAKRWTRPTVSAAEVASASMRELREAAVSSNAGPRSEVDGDGDTEMGEDQPAQTDTDGPLSVGKKRKAPSNKNKDDDDDDDDVNVAIEDMPQARKDLQSRLSSKDAILDPRVKGWMAQWLRRKGEGESAKRSHKRARRDVDLLIEMLSSGFDGYAEYTGLAVRWLQVLEQTPSLRGTPQHKPPSGEGAGAAAGSETQKNGSGLSAKEGNTDRDPPPAAVDYLSKLVEQHFDKEKLATMMEDEEPPAWLKGMLRCSQWRATLIRLADKHKTVPLLDFAVRAMCKEGHHAEVAQVMSPASYFAVFRRTFTDLLREILDCGDDGRGNSPAELSKLEERFRELAGHSQYTYFFAMEALEALEGSDDLPEGLEGSPAAAATAAAGELRVNSTLLRSKMRRLRQGLMNVPRKQDSAERGRQSAVQLCMPLNRRNEFGLSASPAQGGFPSLATLLRTCLADRMFKPEAFAQLRAIFDPERNPEASLVPLWPLRRLEVILLLVTQLFDPFREMDAACIEDGAYVTAVAAARVPGKGLEREVFVALVDAIKICKDSKTMSMEALQVDSPSVKTLSSLVAEYPIVSSGVIRFARNCMLSQAFQKERYFYTGMSVMLHLIRCAARAHPLQRIMAFFALCHALPMNPLNIYQAKLLDIKKLIVDEFIFLIEMGFVFQVLEFVRNQALQGHMDAHLVRHFVVRLAKTVGSNLSPEFAKAVLQLVTLDACGRAVRMAYNRDDIRLVSDLRARCQNTVALASTMPSSAVSSSVMQFASTSSAPRPGPAAKAATTPAPPARSSGSSSSAVSQGLARTSSIVSAASAASRGLPGTASRREKISLVPFRPK